MRVLPGRCVKDPHRLKLSATAGSEREGGEAAAGDGAIYYRAGPVDARQAEYQQLSVFPTEPPPLAPMAASRTAATSLPQVVQVPGRRNRPTRAASRRQAGSWQTISPGARRMLQTKHRAAARGPSHAHES